MLGLNILNNNEIQKIKNSNISKQRATGEINMYFNFKCGDCYLQDEGLIDERPEFYIETCRKCFCDTKNKFCL